MPNKTDIDPLSITDGKISNLANINPKKLAKATEGQILVAQSDGRFAAKSLSGDISLQASGAATVTSVVTAEGGGTTTVVTGPAGPTGAQGPAGAQGAQGPAGSDATVTTSAVDSAGAVMETDLVQTSAGAGDASKPIKLDSTGKIDASMIDDGDISYNNIADVPSTFAPSSHNHDDRYYTETETDSLLAAKAASSHNHAASEITSGTLADARVAQSNVTQHQAAIDHDALTNFAANEHIDWTTDQGTTNIHSGNYTDTTYTSSDFDHDALTNYDAAEHRVIDDSSTTDQDKLWSAYQITNQLGTKSDTSHTHSAATTSANGFMSSTDKTKLNGVATGAEVNVQSDWNASSGDAQILNKPNVHYTSAIATGNNGLVPSAGSSGQFLAHDGTFATPPDTNTQLSDEQVQDIVGAMFTGNTETNITATYQDSDGTIDLVASAGSGTVSSSDVTSSTTDGNIAVYTGSTEVRQAPRFFYNGSDHQVTINETSSSSSNDSKLYVNGNVEADSYLAKDNSGYYLKPAGDSDYIAAKIGGSLFCYDVNTDVSAPTGYAGIYAKTYSSNVRLFASDGLTTSQISPHDEHGNWIHHSYNFADKKRTIINMTELVKAVEDLTGRSFTTEEIEE